MESTSTWLITIGILSAVIAFDLILAILRRNKETSMREAAIWTFIYVSAAIAFGYFMPNWTPSPTAQKEFFAGWLTEYALSVDNIFVFVIILSRLQIDKTKQQLVLLLGIIIALVLRGVFIAAGTAIITRFSSAFFIFGAFLIYTAYQLLREDGNEEEEQEDSRIVKFMRSKGASSFTIALITLGVTDLVFALDSIPAIFGITKDPYIVFFSNIFAIMGLRSLFFLISNIMHLFSYLKYGLGVLLSFIGCKMIFEHWFKAMGVNNVMSLIIILSILAVSIILSIAFPPKKVD